MQFFLWIDGNQEEDVFITLVCNSIPCVSCISSSLNRFKTHPKGAQGTCHTLPTLSQRANMVVNVERSSSILAVSEEHRLRHLHHLNHDLSCCFQTLRGEHIDQSEELPTFLQSKASYLSRQVDDIDVCHKGVHQTIQTTREGGSVCDYSCHICWRWWEWVPIEGSCNPAMMLSIFDVDVNKGVLQVWCQVQADPCSKSSHRIRWGPSRWRVDYKQCWRVTCCVAHASLTRSSQMWELSSNSLQQP